MILSATTPGMKSPDKGPGTTTRSRTGCMTCRKRKLKCDETRPRCGQCTKANRDCEPSTGITFRHQHNASLNALDGGPSAQQNQLKSFYNYRESFGRDTIWAVLPKGDFTFHNISNPYEDPTEPNSIHPGRESMTYPQNPYQQPSSQEYASNAVAQLQAAVSSMPHPHSLHALSQAIELHTPPQATMLPQPPSNPGNPYEASFDDGPSGIEASPGYASTPAVATAKKALNTPTVVDPSIDPDLSELLEPSRRHERKSPHSNNERHTSPPETS